MTTFTKGGSSTTIEIPPVLPITAGRKLYQTDAIDSTGDRYVADRSGYEARPVSLVFPVVTPAELANLITFLSVTVAGSQYLFTWTDNLGGVHSVRLAAWSWLQVAPGVNRVTLSLMEVLI